MWTLPVWVLNDERYADEMTVLLSTFPEQHQHLSAHERWVLLKLTIANVTRNFCMLTAAARHAPCEVLWRTCAWRRAHAWRDRTTASCRCAP